MTPERWERIETLFDRAMDLPSGERESYLRAHCEGDTTLVDEVLRLLQHGERSLEIVRSTLQPSRESLVGRILGDFELVEPIGEGGMGVVYRARQISLQRDVAVKLLLPSLRLLPRHLERFERDAKAAAKLDHPGVVAIHAVGRDGDVPYFAMELVRGPDLAREISRLRVSAAGTGSLPRFDADEYMSAVAEIAAQAADALAFAHGRGIVHRDVKPANLLLDEQRRVRIVDFGLARDESLGTITRSKELAGTPYYMSPEQVRESLHSVDARTDVYSLGVVLYELLTLTRPFDGSTQHEILTRIVTKDAKRPSAINPRVPRDLEVICLTAMAREVGERYSSAAELRDDLRRFLRHEAIRAQPTPLARRIARFARRRAGVLAAVGAAALVGLAASHVGESRARARDREAELAGLAELESSADWLAVPLAQRARAKQQVEVLRESWSELRDEERAALTRFEQRMSDHERDLRTRTADLVAQALQTPAGVEPFDGARLLAGFSLLSDAEVLAGSTPVARDIASSAVFEIPLSVRAELADGAPLTGRALVRAIDPVLGIPGEAVELGSLPVEGKRLRPGLHRIIVVPEGFPQREYTRLVTRASESIEIRTVIDPRIDPTAGMVLVRGGVLAIPPPSTPSFCPYAGTSLEIESFLLDDAAVSVGEYRAYMSRAGVQRPAFWRNPGASDVWSELADGRHDDLPITGVSWYEAQAYSESVGKRLVTAPERDFAARGPSGELFPYAVAPGASAYRGNVTGSRSPCTTAEALARAFLEQASPVRAHPEARSEPHGFYDMLGNVSEWTDSLGVDLDGDRHVCRPASRLVLGAPWYAQACSYTLAARALHGPEDSHALPEIGFRCARSAATE